MRTVVVDLDDTLFNAGHRKHLVDVKDGKPDFKAFNEMSKHDTPNDEVVEKVLKWQDQGNEVVIFSGRTDNMKPDTEKQLKNLGIKPSAIYMRSEEDRTPSSKLKEKWLEELKDRDIVAAIDDHDGNIRMFRRHGINSYKVKDGKVEVNKYLEKIASKCIKRKS